MMTRVNARKRSRRLQGSGHSGVGWLVKNDDPSFKAGLTLLWALLLLIVSAFALDWMLRPDNFPVENVDFEGQFKHVTRQQLIDVLNGEVGGNFYALDLDAVKARVESLPWVYRASVRRNWPRDLHIRLTEQRFVARWGDRAWLNQASELVRLRSGAPLERLPRLYGPAGTHTQVLTRYRSFSRALEPVGLKVTAITLTPRRSYRVQLDNGVALVLARENPDARIERFARAYRGALASHAMRIKQVDLRYTNGFSVKWADPPALLSRVDVTREH
jgi:cell division protein FtsQ